MVSCQCQGVHPSSSYLQCLHHTHTHLSPLGTIHWRRADAGSRRNQTHTFCPPATVGAGLGASITSSPSPNWPQSPSPMTKRSPGTCKCDRLSPNVCVTGACQHCYCQHQCPPCRGMCGTQLSTVIRQGLLLFSYGRSFSPLSPLPSSRSCQHFSSPPS